MTAVIRVLRFQEIFIIAPQLLLLLLLLLQPLPLFSRSSQCPTTVEEMVVSTTSDAERLAEALLCDGPAAFTVSWNGDIVTSRTLHVSNGSTLEVTGSSENSDDVAITSDGTVLLFQVDLGSTVSLTELTLSGGDGALRVTGASFVEVINCSFTQNKRTSSDEGGAVYVYGGSSVALKGENFFRNNTAIYGGGAIYADDHSNVSFGGYAYFDNNTATNGGAIAVVDGSTIHIDGKTSFEGNEAISNGGAIYASGSSVSVEAGARFLSNHASIGSGGGVYALSSVIALTDAEFKQNHGAKGGGIASFISTSDEGIGGIGPSKITGCRFDGNTATDGGAIYSIEGFNEVVNSSFTRNYAVVRGGALLHAGILVALTGCTFESNMAGENGLAVTIFGLVNDISHVSFRNNSFYCDSGEYGLVEDVNAVVDPICRLGVVCSGCTEQQCNASDIIDMNETTVPFCEVVPDGVNTTGNGGMTLETLNLMPGFYRTSNKSREVLKCYRAKSCLGGSDASHYCADGYVGPWFDFSIDLMTKLHVLCKVMSYGSSYFDCTALYAGPCDCAACDKGYQSGFQYSCHSCQGSHKWATIGVAVTVLAVVMFVVVLGVAYLVGVEDRPNAEGSGMWERRVSNFRDGLVRIIPLTAVKIVLVCWQIITQFSSVVNVQYPPAYEKFLVALDVANLNLGSILSLSCVVETNLYARLYLVTIAPMAVLGVLMITYRVAMLRNGHSIRAKRMAKNKHLSVGLFVLFIVYSSVSYTIFQAFVCDPLDSGVTYLRVDYDIECWTGAHSTLMMYAGLMIIVYPVGIPAVFAWVLYINRDGIKNVAGTTDRSRVPPELEAIKDLWAPYKRSRYYYEVVECGRRIAGMGLARFIYPGSTAQVAIEALFAVVYISFSEILSPFAEPLDAWLYRSATWTVFLSMLHALLLKMDMAGETSNSQGSYAWVLVVAHVGMILIVITNAFLSVLKGFREVRDVEMPVRTQEPFQCRSASTYNFSREIKTTPAVNITPV